MGKIISIANPKGGVGKTITSINLAAALAYLNQKVLLIDLDPKGDASKGIGIDTSSVEYNIYSIMLKHENIRKAIEDYKNGKVKAIQALFGSCMKELKGAADPAVIKATLEAKLNN